MSSGEINECRAGACSRRNERFKFNERDVEGAVPYECEIVQNPSTVSKIAIVLDRRGRNLLANYPSDVP